MKRVAYIGFGSNLGQPEQNLRTACLLLGQHPKITVARISPLYLTEPLTSREGEQQPWYLNAVFEVRTILGPCQILTALKNIETLMGRRPAGRWQPRICDLDILLYENMVYADDQLYIPHPHLTQRRFVLKPLCDLIPDFVHPQLNKTLANLLLHADNTLVIEPWQKQSNAIAPC